VMSGALKPIAALYQAAAKLRQVFARPYRAGVPVICVGNVVAGGAGKTPTALALAALLKSQDQNPVFVTRGYGGAQHGPLRVDAAHHGAVDVGDEALLLLRQAPVWIGRDRAAAIREAEKFASHIILDDGLQNPNIEPSLSILVMDAVVGLGNGETIPAGPLREPFADALQRVIAILLIGSGDVAELKDCGKPVFRAKLVPAIPADFPREEKFLAFAGIGRPKKFYDLCRREELVLAGTRDFPDHHPFSLSELEQLENQARGLGAKLLTTEKDFVRLPSYFQTRILTFPIRLEFEEAVAVRELLARAIF